MKKHATAANTGFTVQNRSRPLLCLLLCCNPRSSKTTGPRANKQMAWRPTSAFRILSSLPAAGRSSRSVQDKTPTRDAWTDSGTGLHPGPPLDGQLEKVRQEKGGGRGFKNYVRNTLYTLHYTTQVVHAHHTETRPPRRLADRVTSPPWAVGWQDQP